MRPSSRPTWWNEPLRSSISTAPTRGNERPIEEFLTPGLTCPACGGTEFERERDILDVWFDSGSSHEAYCRSMTSSRGLPTCTWRAAINTVAGSRARCWSVSARGRPPFREVLTHGFLIDVDGRKMSKSLGNTILPQEVIKESGAETLRLWVAMMTRRARVGKQIPQRTVEAYRKIRE